MFWFHKTVCRLVTRQERQNASEMIELFMDWLFHIVSGGFQGLILKAVSQCFHIGPEQSH